MLIRRTILLFTVLSVMGCTRSQTARLVENPLLQGPFRNINIHTSAGSTGPCEPSISINPTNTDKIIAGSVLDNLYISQDGGLSWKAEKLTSTFGVYGDPVVRHDLKGNVYYSHLSNSKGKAYASEEFLDRIVVQRSSDHGKTWTNGSFPPVDHKKDHDKQWKAIHPVTGDIAMTWTEFDKYGSADKNHKSRILFSISKDEGETWSDAVVISDLEGDCLDDDNTTEGAHPAFGINGEIYVVWSYNEKIWMDESSDGGKTWGKDTAIGNQPGGWAFSIPGIRRCNGFPTLKIDHSVAPTRGNLYVQWADQRQGNEDTNIWCIVSENGGRTWSNANPVHENQSGRHQFFSWMDLDIATGYIYLVYYDRRNHESESTDVFLSYSMDGGKTFRDVQISESPFTVVPSVFFGDYNDISAVNGTIRPVWTRQEGNTLRVYTAIIQHK